MRLSTIVGALVVSSIALLSLGVLPVLLGGLEEAGRLSKAGIGQAAMLELFGVALGAAVGGFWMGQGVMRLKAVTVALSLVIINVATAHAPSTAIVLLDRAFAGLFAGLLFGAGNAIIVRSNNPDRLTGILVGASVVPQIALAYLIPVAVIPRFGVEAGFYTVAAGMLVAVPFACTLVDKVSILDRPERGRSPLSGALLLFAGTLVLQSCGFGAAWTYLERLANQHGFGSSVVGLALAGSLGAQVVAGWLSAWICPKVARRAALLVLLASQGGFIALTILIGSPGVFIFAACMFGSAACAMQAFQVAEIIVLDATRRTAVLVGPMILFGCGLGSLIASFATTEADVRGGSWAAVAMTTAAALLYVASFLRTAHGAASPLLEETASPL